MSSDFLPPLFRLGTGLGFFVFLLLGLTARRAFATLAGKLTGFGLILIPLAMLLLAQATEGTMNRGATLFAAAGGVLLLSAILVASGLFIGARNASAASR